MLFSDRRRAFSWMLLGAAIFYLALHINGVSILLDEWIGNALMIFEFGGVLGYAEMLMPLIAALPFAASFCLDYGHGYTVPVALRAGKARAVRSKAVSAALSGGLAVMGGTLLFILVLNLRFPPDMGALPEGFVPYELNLLLNLGGPLGYISYYLACLLCQFLAGSFWALVALCFSSFYPNLSLTLCVPLVLHQLIRQLSQVVRIPIQINPVALENGYLGMEPLPALLWVVGTFTVLNLLLALVFCWRAGRRLRYA